VSICTQEPNFWHRTGDFGPHVVVRLIRDTHAAQAVVPAQRGPEGPPARIPGVKTLALAPVAVAWLLAAPTTVGSGQIWSTFDNPRLGHTLRIPPGWRASTRPADGVTVITSVAAPNRNDNPDRITLPRAGVYVSIFDYGRVSGDFPPLPSRIELGKEEMHTCGFGEGYALHFRDHGRLLDVFVKLGPHADRDIVLAVLNSLRLTK
jgi:hypothetical protein